MRFTTLTKKLEQFVISLRWRSPSSSMLPDNAELVQHLCLIYDYVTIQSHTRSPFTSALCAPTRSYHIIPDQLVCRHSSRFGWNPSHHALLERSLVWCHRFPYAVNQYLTTMRFPRHFSHRHYWCSMAPYAINERALNRWGNLITMPVHK